MKNASGDQIARANFHYEFVPNTVYSVEFTSSGTAYDRKVHVLRRGARVVFEDMQGNLYIPDACCGIIVTQVAKGPAQQPKRIKRKPVKGTKPEQLIPMNESVKLKVGDKVLLKNGVRTTVDKVDKVGVDLPYYLPGKGWYCPAGIYCIGMAGDEHSITHKIVPWQEQNHLYINGKLAGVVTDLKFTPQQEKSPEQEAFEAGFWVPHIATQDSVCPPWAEDVLINTLLLDERDPDTDWAQIGSKWGWVKHDCSDIVAYRKAPKQ